MNYPPTEPKRLLRASDGELAVQTATVIESRVCLDPLSARREFRVQPQLAVMQQRLVGAVGVADGALRGMDRRVAAERTRRARPGMQA